MTARVYLQNLKVKLSSEKKSKSFSLGTLGGKNLYPDKSLRDKDLEVIEQKDLELMDTYNKISLVLETTNYQPNNQRRKGRRSIRQRRN